jgi:replicative DNA helicase
MRQKPTNYTPSMLEHGKIPPQATDLEEAVLGALMLENDAISDVMDVVRPESFYRIEHQKIFHAIVSLTEASKPVDILTVTHFLKQEGTLDLVGGAYFVSQLTDRAASSANAEFHARIIQQKFIARELIRVSGDIYNKAFDDTTDALELLDDANLTVADIGSDINSEKGAKSNMELVNEVIADAERASKGNSIVGIQTEIPDVDRLTGGWEGGKVYILAGRPASGKSSKAMQDAYYMAVKLKYPVLFFSLEMTAKELMLRIISKHIDIDANLIKTGRLTPEQWDLFNSSMQEIIDSPLEIIDHLYSLMDIRKKILMHKKRHGLKGVFVDYIQKILYEKKGANEEQQLSYVSNALKILSKQTDCPFIVLAQLSRAVETRGGSKKPMLSDLRGSGQLEADADQVHFMYRPEYYGIETSDEYGDTHGLAELIVAKNRGGATGTAPMRFHPKTTSFSPWEQTSFSAPSPNDIPDTPRSTAMKPSTQFDIDNIDNGDDTFDSF